MSIWSLESHVDLDSFGDVDVLSLGNDDLFNLRLLVSGHEVVQFLFPRPRNVIKAQVELLDHLLEIGRVPRDAVVVQMDRHQQLSLGHDVGELHHLGLGNRHARQIDVVQHFGLLDCVVDVVNSLFGLIVFVGVLSTKAKVVVGQVDVSDLLVHLKQLLTDLIETVRPDRTEANIEELEVLLHVHEVSQVQQHSFVVQYHVGEGTLHDIGSCIVLVQVLCQLLHHSRVEA